MVYHFAYGSNMDCCQMRDRCPSARFVAIARLENYLLALTRFSKRRKCGVADAIPYNGEEVWGVVYDINEEEFGYLDEFEGVPAAAYKRVTKDVLLRELSGERGARAEVYFVTAPETIDLNGRKKGKYCTNEGYKALLLKGAKAHLLPSNYIGKKLETLPVE